MWRSFVYYSCDSLNVLFFPSFFLICPLFCVRYMGNALFSYDGYVVTVLYLPVQPVSIGVLRLISSCSSYFFLVFCIICGYLQSLVLLLSQVDISIIIIIIQPDGRSKDSNPDRGKRFFFSKTSIPAPPSVDTGLLSRS